ncbi:MAG TPA: tyrosine--tRNA ligase [Thermomicrobiales bacterium]|nr:tyrosine--tRNA ligase [Thermomicrobiales bacterium]
MVDTHTRTQTGPELARRAGVNPLDYLRSRGFIQDVTDEDGLREAFASGPVTVYVGFDPTATSLHVGNLVGIMALANLQRLGHRPIALAGGGTVMVGDPSGKTDARQLLTVETIEQNLVGIRKQLAHHYDFEGGRYGDNPPALLINNADWLLGLELIPFLRDIGKHFSVNEMLATDTYRTRLETTGLNFIEFNYRVLQAYDFLHLFEDEACRVQAGGTDQWANIVAGVDLIRRQAGGKAFAFVWPLITTSSGQKMGKSESGAIWLDPEQLSPFDFFQFWINTTDDDVARFMRLFTFLPDERVDDLTSVTGSALREAKAVLAWEATALTHGADAASEAAAASRALFSRDASMDAVMDSDAAVDVTLTEGMTFAELFTQAGLVSSRNEARRLAEQGGMTIDDERVPDANAAFAPNGETAVLRAGRKRVRLVRFTSNP